MKKVKVKIPAKINLTFDILGEKNGYHDIESLVASVDIYDTITAKIRKENFVSVAFSGVPIHTNATSSNAYFAADFFRKNFYTGGTEITVDRNIPVAAGLGGSSADIAGVLIALKKLYGVNSDLLYIANKLGSDVAYMMHGGFAVMKNRGETVEFLPDIKKKFYLLIVCGTQGVNTADCYRGFDKLGKTYFKTTGVAKSFLLEDDDANLFASLKNDLYESANVLLPEISETLKELKKYAPASMTGSGSATYAIFVSKKERDNVYKKLLPLFGDRLIKAQTV